mmetsp:Transcript_12308/g.29037  ORF Transcript_12308/g.29037 Transcript_12308/m.29037 type:complete len:234 (-) Transcript_12308:103-804(-)
MAPEIGGHVRGLREREEEGGYWRVRSEGGVEWLVGGPGRRAEGREGGVEGGLVGAIIDEERIRDIEAPPERGVIPDALKLLDGHGFVELDRVHDARDCAITAIHDRLQHFVVLLPKKALHHPLHVVRHCRGPDSQMELVHASLEERVQVRSLVHLELVHAIVWFSADGRWYWALDAVHKEAIQVEDQQLLLCTHRAHGRLRHAKHCLRILGFFPSFTGLFSLYSWSYARISNV